MKAYLKIKRAAAGTEPGLCLAPQGCLTTTAASAGLRADRPLNRDRHLVSGLSLIEVLVAIAVLAVGISAIIGLQTATYVTSSNSNTLSMATFLVESQVEYIKARGSSNLQYVSRDPEKLTRSGLNCDNPIVEPCVFTRTTTIEDSVPTTVSSAVSIKVEWDGGSMIYDTVISRIGF